MLQSSSSKPQYEANRQLEEAMQRDSRGSGMSVGLDTLAVGTLVLIVPFQLATSLGTGGTLTRLVGAIAGALSAIRILKHGALARRRYWSFVVALASYLALTCLWSIDLSSSLSILATVLLNLALYSLISAVPRTHQENAFIVRCILASGLVTAVWVIVGWFLSGNTIVSSGIRAMIWVSGQSVDPNHVAAALILPLAVLLSSDRISKWLFAVFAWALLGIALVLTGSRGGAVGVACMMVVALPGMRRGSRGMVIRTALVVVPACLVALSLVPGLLASLESRFSVVSAVLSGGAGRILLWRIGWRAFLAHPWFGTGIGSFQTAFDMTNPGYVTYSSINVAHNIYLQLLVETGVCGLALFLGLAWQIGMSYSKLARCRWAAMAGMLASSLFLGTLTASYFWLAVFFSWIAAPAVEEAGDSVATGVGGVECAR